VSPKLLAELNPDRRFDRSGETISVPNIRAEQSPVGSIARIEVDKSKETVSALDPAGKMVAFFPATVGSTEKPTPSGTLKVTSTEANPTYRYDPSYHFAGVKSKKPFTIRPGPNNPAGSYWIGLSAQGYGIHGTAAPDRVGKTASHGCVRLTNWDARFLGEHVKRGTPVAFLDAPNDATVGKAR
jgi:lipoprotein-anchoring transpeptidase ErfK/SrfK